MLDAMNFAIVTKWYTIYILTLWAILKAQVMVDELRDFEALIWWSSSHWNKVLAFQLWLKRFQPCVVVDFISVACHCCTWVLTYWTGTLMFSRNRNECLHYIGACSQGNSRSDQAPAGGSGVTVSSNWWITRSHWICGKFER